MEFNCIPFWGKYLIRFKRSIAILHIKFMRVLLVSRHPETGRLLKLIIFYAGRGKFEHTHLRRNLSLCLLLVGASGIYLATMTVASKRCRVRNMLSDCLRRLHLPSRDLGLNEMMSFVTIFQVCLHVGQSFTAAESIRTRVNVLGYQLSFLTIVWIKWKLCSSSRMIVMQWKGPVNLLRKKNRSNRFQFRFHIIIYFSNYQYTATSFITQLFITRIRL